MNAMPAAAQASANSALRGRPRADTDGLVRLRHMRRISIGLRVNRNRTDIQALQRPQDPARDLAAIRDQNLMPHHRPK